jgi:hypothetical protein
MTSVAQRLEKLGYDSSQYSVETTRPVYELSDKELERRLSYERGEMGPRVGLSALGGAALGGLTGLTMDPTRVAPALMGAGIGAAAAAGGSYVANRLKRMETERENDRRSPTRKTASLAEYSNLFDAVEQGKFGPHVKEALVGVCEGMSYSLQSSHATKVAAAPTEADARQARINQLLRKM